MEIGLGAFVKFANATPRTRPYVAREIAEQVSGEYDPAKDFWRPMRQAISRDRKTSRDGEALRQVVSGAPSRRRPSFEHVSQRWGDVSARWNNAEHVRSSKTSVELSGLLVRLNPLFVERLVDGRLEAAHMYFNKSEPLTDTLQAVQHVLARGSHPGAIEPVFVDMRRARVVPAASFGSELDERLERLGLEFQRLVA
jgi:hypothetical protein